MLSGRACLFEDMWLLFPVVSGSRVVYLMSPSVFMYMDSSVIFRRSSSGRLHTQLRRYSWCLIVMAVFLLSLEAARSMAFSSVSVMVLFLHSLWPASGLDSQSASCSIFDFELSQFILSQWKLFSSVAHLETFELDLLKAVISVETLESVCSVTSHPAMRSKNVANASIIPCDSRSWGFSLAVRSSWTCVW